MKGGKKAWGKKSWERSGGLLRPTGTEKVQSRKRGDWKKGTQTKTHANRYVYQKKIEEGGSESWMGP